MVSIPHVRRVLVLMQGWMETHTVAGVLCTESKCFKNKFYQCERNHAAFHVIVRTVTDTLKGQYHHDQQGMESGVLVLN